MADDMVSGSGGLGDVEFDDSGTATGIDDGGDDDDGGGDDKTKETKTKTGGKSKDDGGGGTGAPEGDNDDRSDFGSAMEGFRESADAGELEGQDQASGEAREDLNETVGAYLEGDVSDEELNESVESFLNEGDGGGAGSSQQGQDPGDVSVDPGDIDVDEGETASGGIDPGDIDADESQVNEGDTSTRQPAGSGSPIEEGGSSDTVSGSGGLGDVEFDESGRATGVNAGGGDSGRDGNDDRSDFGSAMEGFRESAEAGELEGQPGGDGGMRDTQLEQETGTSTDDVRSGQAAAPPTAAEDLTRVDQELGQSADETSGFEDPDQIEGGLSGVRFANERTAEATPGEQTTVAGETFDRGQALPTERQIAREIEGEAVDESPSLGREDIAVVSGEDGLAVDLTGEGEEQVQRQREFQQRQARIEARQAAERDLETQLSVRQRPGQAGPGGVEFSPVDLQQGEDFTFEDRPGGGVRTQLTDSFLKERAASQIDGIGPDEIRVDGDSVELSREGRRSLVEQRVAQERNLDPGEDFSVEINGDEADVELTDEGKIEMAGRTDAPPGDVIASTEGWLRKHATAHRVGEGAIPNLEGVAQSLEDPTDSELDREIGVAGRGGDAERRAKSTRWLGRNALNPAGAALTLWGAGKTGVDLATRRAVLAPAPDVPGREDDFEYGEETTVLSSEASQTAREAINENPNEALASFSAGVIAGAVGGAVSGRALGKVSRAARRRARTVGGTEVDLDDLTQEEVIRGVDPDRPGGDDFPGAQDPDLYESDPPEAVRQQAGDMTPEEVDELFRRHGVDELTTLKKGVEVEPEGPRRGRAGQGFRAQEGNYESPGAFAGPELSPHFLGESRQAAGWSWRPGLPDTGESPTGVLIRTDVDRPDADNMGQFRREMQDRAGETTARTKPAGDVNTGEIETVIPPEAEYAPLPQSRTQSVARRLGIGSRLYTELPDGRRAPLRPVAPASAIDDAPSRGLRDLLTDDRAQLGAAGRASRRTYSLDELRSAGRAGTDRPLPLVPSVGASGRGVDAGDYATDTAASGSSAVGRGSATGGYDSPDTSLTARGVDSGGSEGPLGGSYLRGGSDSPSYSRGGGSGFGGSPSPTRPASGGESGDASSPRLPGGGSAGGGSSAPTSPSTGGGSSAPTSPSTGGGSSAPTSPSTGGGSSTPAISVPGGSSSPGPSPPGGSSTPGSSAPGGSSIPGTSIPGGQSIPGQSIPGTSVPGGVGIPGGYSVGIPTTARYDRESDSDEEREDIEFNKSPPAADSNLGPGWFAEYVTAVALGATADRSNPGESELEGRPAAQEYTSTLPVESQVSGSEEEQEAIQEAYEALTFGDGGSDGDGDPFDFGGFGGSWF